MATTEPIIPCPRCGHVSEVIDRKTDYRLEEKDSPGTVGQVPSKTYYTHRCKRDGCGHIFTRSVKH